MFSVGVIAFILMGGYPPFMAENQSALLRMICEGKYQFHEKFWAPISQKAKDLINALLMLDPKKRISAKDALEHAWFVSDGRELAAKNLSHNLNELEKFNSRRKSF